MLSPAELETLDGLLQLIKDKNFYHSSRCSKQGQELVKKLLKFPAAEVFPCLDVYRMFLLHPSSSENFKVFQYGLEYLNILLAFL